MIGNLAFFKGALEHVEDNFATFEEEASFDCC